MDLFGTRAGKFDMIQRIMQYPERTQNWEEHSDRIVQKVTGELIFINVNCCQWQYVNGTIAKSIYRDSVVYSFWRQSDVDSFTWTGFGYGWDLKKRRDMGDYWIIPVSSMNRDSDAYRKLC